MEDADKDYIQPIPSKNTMAASFILYFAEFSQLLTLITNTTTTTVIVMAAV